MGVRGELFSTKVSTEKRTYFFNVKENRMGDAFLNIVESKKEGEGEFERHQIMVYQEEIEVFIREFQKAAGVLLKHKETHQSGASRPAPRARSAPSGESSHDASKSSPAKHVVRKSRAPAAEPPRPTYELDGNWKGPESMKTKGSKVTRISRKQIEERSAKKSAAAPAKPLP